MRTLQLAAMLGAAIFIRDARADEGMWTFHDFPSAKVKAKYGFSPDQPWLDKARMASARLAGICSASVVSDSGLVMTNHHCAHDCVAGLSSKEHDYVKDGFWAPKLEDEKKCPDLEVQQLDQITDVTQQVLKATAGKTGAAYTAALREASSAIEKPCQTANTVRCEVVNLYHGGQFMLYRYKRYTDVRVVGVPEFAIAFFGGDAMMRKQADAEATLRKQVPDAFDAIEKAHAKFKPLFRRYLVLEKWSKGDLLNDAIRLVRAADERAVANGQRLDEYRDSALPDIEQKVMSTAAIYPAREKLALAFWLGKVREELGADDPTVRALLGKQSPMQVAERLVDATKLGDQAERARLFKGGKAAVAASRDPMIAFVHLFDGAARKVRKINDDDVEV